MNVLNATWTVYCEMTEKVNDTPSKGHTRRADILPGLREVTGARVCLCQSDWGRRSPLPAADLSMWPLGIPEACPLVPGWGWGASPLPSQQWVSPQWPRHPVLHQVEHVLP